MSEYIGAYWGSRIDSLHEISKKIIHTLNGLAKIDDHFLVWYEGNNSKKLALEKKIILNNETIERLCLSQVKKKELDEAGFTKSGFLFGLWSGHKDKESSSITFTVGSSFESRYLSNSCVLKIPYEGPAHERLLNLEVSKRIIVFLIETWNPDYAVLTSDSLRNTLNIGNRVGWITYHQNIKQVPKSSQKLAYESLDKGHLFYLTSRLERHEKDAIQDLLLVKDSI